MFFNKLLPLSCLCMTVLLASCSADETVVPTAAASLALSRVPVNPTNAAQVTIGTQVWMAKNLDVDHYRNGDVIPQISDATQWANATTGAWCYYQNNAGNGPIYGKLYNRYAVSDPRGLSPQGWHVATDAEYTALWNALGASNTVGGKLKATALWNSPNTGATNEVGFTALPAGWRNFDGAFAFKGQYAFWWTSTYWGVPGENAFYYNRQVSYNDAVFVRSNSGPTYGYSVRCLRD